MRYIGSSIVSTHTPSQLFGGKPPIGFDHITLAVDPFGLNGIEPRALRRQQKRQDPHAFAHLLDLRVVLTKPGANRLTLMPGSIIPHQEPVGLALLEQTLAAPVQELRADRAHWSPSDKTQPHPLTSRLLGGPLLPKHAIAGQRFGVEISFFPRLFDEARRVLRVLPGVHTR